MLCALGYNCVGGSVCGHLPPLPSESDACVVIEVSDDVGAFLLHILM